jgi:hypothetical protein
MSFDFALRPLFVLTLETEGGAIHVGAVPTGYIRRVVIVTGGNFAGDRLSGRVLGGGGDFMTMRPDGGMNLDVRLVLETQKGERIYVTYLGRRNGGPEIMARYRNLEPVGRGEDYFRASFLFETASVELSWLNDIIAIGAGYRLATGPVYEVFEVQ